ncbi:MAG: acyltransferase, partial [Verrucomicrobia bacterium]
MPNSSKTKIALIQMRCAPVPEKNFSRVIEFIREATGKGAQIVCLPELFRSQYFCQTEDHKNFDLAEEIPGKSTSALGEVARDTGAVIIASLFEKRSAGLYHNTAAIIDANGKLLGKYRKMHIPDDPLYHEKFYFAPGDLGFQAWPTTRGKIGVCI